MASARKKQERLSKTRWKALIAALDAIRKRGAKKPNYQDFVKVHGG